MIINRLCIVSAVSGAAILVTGMAGAATIKDWNLDNVVVGATDGSASASVVYNGDPAIASSTSSGQIAYTPPEAVAPGIQVIQEEYTQGGSGGGGLTLDGCIMTSNPTNTCTGVFQSGKRIKTQMTGLDPVDLVFNVEAGAEANYQVFYRLINKTSQALAGFALELGFGVGSEFVRATAEDGITFSTTFRAQPALAGASATTQFPFGLFGDAASNENFEIDGFFAPERTGLNVAQSATTLESTAFFGPYTSLFPFWLSQESVPLGAFWDNDGDASTDALLMAWLNPDGLWEVRRDVADLPAGEAESLSMAEFFSSFDEVVARLGLGGSLFEGAIEDLANLNVNYAINLASSVGTGNFTLRTTVFSAPVSPVPLPYSAPLLAGGLGLMGLIARRRKRATA